MAERHSKSVASMVLGICSLVLCWTGFGGVILGIIAIVLASKGMAPKQAGRGMAIAGLVTGIIGLIMGFIYFLIWLTLIYTLI